MLSTSTRAATHRYVAECDEAGEVIEAGPEGEGAGVGVKVSGGFFKSASGSLEHRAAGREGSAGAVGSTLRLVMSIAAGIAAVPGEAVLVDPVI